jgi:hypothetical protein
MHTILRPPFTLTVVLLACAALSGCNSYMLQGKVIRGAQSDIQLVYAGDERLKEPGVSGVDIRVTRDATTLNRHLVGRTTSSGAGEFTLLMDEFGTGWMQEQWLLQTVAAGYQNAETTMNLPSKHSKWRLLVTLAPGTATPIPDQDQMMRDLEQFK